MSKVAINNYYNEIEKLKKFGKTVNESSLRSAFYTLIRSYLVNKDLILVEELTDSKSGKRPDGTVKNNLGLDFGYIESKDIKDNLDEEVEHKLSIGYRDTNIIFENGKTIILIQNGIQIYSEDMDDSSKLDEVLNAFCSYESEEIRDFNIALSKFSEDVPKITKELNKLLDKELKENSKYKESVNNFLGVCRESINEYVTSNDIKEMIIQHVLTENIFSSIFNDTHVHNYNSVSKNIKDVINNISNKHIIDTTKKIEYYYAELRAKASSLSDYNEKQKFLKLIYEEFYKSYNPENADKLGVVYTPNEIVDFMIKSSDYLLEKHFNKTLGDSGVEILDPCTGTGTFITNLLNYLPPKQLKNKYKNEISANEISILPYYIASLNIETLYFNRTGEYDEFDNLVFVDTLDNINFKGSSGNSARSSLFGSISDENLERINRQNSKKISVIIGNPPYNANQLNYNNFNANRVYKEIDSRIKETFIRESKAQKTKVYDMYSRFYRWAMDRVDDDGVVAFVTNGSFIDSKTFDGFRKVVSEEFDYIYILDLGGKYIDHMNEVVSGTVHNVFGIKPSVSIMFLVKCSKDKREKAKINYFKPYDFMLRDEKLAYLRDEKLKDIEFTTLKPDKYNNWLNTIDEDSKWFNLIPLTDRELKSGNVIDGAIFKLYSNGVATNRDSWVYDFSKTNLENKIKHFTDKYNKSIEDKKLDTTIKWSDSLKNSFDNKTKSKFNKDKIVKSMFRPFTLRYYYSERLFSDRLTQNHYETFGEKLDRENVVIAYNTREAINPLVSKYLVDLHMNGDVQFVPLYIYGKDGERSFNISKADLELVQKHYGDSSIDEVMLFNYIYAMLHSDDYKSRYKVELKQELPRLELYSEFSKLSTLGDKLLKLHVEFESAKPFKLKRVDSGTKEGKAKLSLDKDSGILVVDEMTALTNIPKEVFSYKLGNRSAVEWAIDQYKEKTIIDKTISGSQFDNYKFNDYKDEFISLICKLTTLSIESIELIKKINSLVK